MSTRKKTATLTSRPDPQWRRLWWLLNTPTFVIVKDGSGDYYVTSDGVELQDREGRVRYFVSRNSARKRISRERRLDFHN